MMLPGAVAKSNKICIDLLLMCLVIRTFFRATKAVLVEYPEEMLD